MPRRTGRRVADGQAPRSRGPPRRAGRPGDGKTHEPARRQMDHGPLRGILHEGLPGSWSLDSSRGAAMGLTPDSRGPAPPLPSSRSVILISRIGALVRGRMSRSDFLQVALWIPKMALVSQLQGKQAARSSPDPVRRTGASRPARVVVAVAGRDAGGPDSTGWLMGA
jgi:hypothetical protein